MSCNVMLCYVMSRNYYLFLTGVESIKQNLTTEELNTSPSRLDNSRDGVLYGVQNLVCCAGVSTLKIKT